MASVAVEGCCDSSTTHHRSRCGPLPAGTLALMLPELDIQRVRRWCAARVPEHLHDELRVEVDVAPRHLTIVETRPPWREDFGPEWTGFPIARLRYTKTTGPWEIYWRDRHLKFHRYDRAEPSPEVPELLEEIERDPTAIFWG